MSAYVVDKRTIVYLIQAALDLPGRTVQGRTLSWYWDTRNDYGQIDSHSAELKPNNDHAAMCIGKMLWNENIRSVSARYPTRKTYKLPGVVSGDALTPQDFSAPWPDIDPVQVLKTCECYKYQSCEHDGWENSEAAAFIQALEYAAVNALPGYEAANWGAPK